jgi:nicotinamidase/pyrazinamidase
MKSDIAMRVAFIVIDMQYDFGDPNGALFVPGGDTVVEPVNTLRSTLEGVGALTVFTQDWHPAEHVSFASNNNGAALFSVVNLAGIGDQVMWPNHCVMNTPGASFLPALHFDAAVDKVIRKGSLRDVDSYSGFGSPGRKRERTALEDTLRAAGVTHVVIAGLALDYCVSYTARDAAELGFRVCVAKFATRGISLDSIEKEMALMKEAGVVVAESAEEVTAFARGNL